MKVELGVRAWYPHRIVTLHFEKDSFRKTASKLRPVEAGETGDYCPSPTAAARAAAETSEVEGEVGSTLTGARSFAA